MSVFIFHPTESARTLQSDFINAPIGSCVTLNLITLTFSGDTELLIDFKSKLKQRD